MVSINMLQEKIHHTKSVPGDVVLELAERLEVIPVTAIIEHYHKIGGDDAVLVEVVSNMGLDTLQ